MKTLRVVLVADRLDSRWVSGAARQVLELAREYRRRGMRPVVLTRAVPDLPRRQEVRGIPVLRLAAWGPGAVGSAVFFLSSFLYLLAFGLRCRAFHAHLSGPGAMSAALAGRLLGRRVVLQVWGAPGSSEAWQARQGFWGRLKLRLLRGLGPKIAAATEELEEEARGCGLSGLSITVVPNGVDTLAFHPLTKERKAQAACEFGWSRGLVFLYMGRFTPRKALAPFLEAWAEAAAQAPEAQLVLMGEGPEEDSLRSKISSLGLDGRVALMRPQEDPARFYPAADVFVLPSLSEGLPNSLLEAMASGLPVLASRVGALRRVLEDGETGFLFDPKDPAELKRKILGILRHPQSAVKVGERGLELVRRRFGIAKAADEYLRLYGVR